MALYNRAISIEQDADESWSFGYATADPSGNPKLAVPFNFTGAVALFTARESQDSTSTLLYSVSSTAQAPVVPITFGTLVTSTGINVATINWSIPNSVSVTLPSGEWYYYLFVTQGGVNTVYASGVFSVVATAGRP